MRRLVVLGALLAPGALFAQHTTRKPARTAGIAPAPASADSTVPARDRHGSVPVMVDPNGRVFADFGSGYEQVRRACGSTNRQDARQDARPLVGVTQPKVAQPTAGIAPAPATPDPSRAHRDACWAKDGRGRIVVR